MAKGYAVAVNGEVNIKTVAQHRLAAIVNWLFIPEGGGLFVGDELSPNEIERMFAGLVDHHQRRHNDKVECLEVEVRRAA